MCITAFRRTERVGAIASRWVRCPKALTLLCAAYLFLAARGTFGQSLAAETSVLPRVFPEAMVPVGGSPTAAETVELRAALEEFSQSKAANRFDLGRLSRFLEQHSESPWRTALRLNLGLEYYGNGYFSRALDSWRQAWKTGKSATDPQGKAIADRALAELLQMLCRLGRVEEIKPLFAELEGRDFRGVTAETIQVARDALWLMENQPEKSFRCGPHALERILAYTRPTEPVCLDLVNSASTTRGIPLTEVAALSKKVGLPMRMAKRGAGAAIPIPCVVHWKLDHYGAVLKHEKGRYLLDDPTFGNGLLWITEDALTSEGSGYFLVPEGALPEGWTAVGEGEGANVWGRGTKAKDSNNLGPGNECGVCPCEEDDAMPGGLDEPDAPPGEFPIPVARRPNVGGGDSKPTGARGRAPAVAVLPRRPDVGGGDSKPSGAAGRATGTAIGMARWNVYLMMASLEVSDTPLGYRPPVGPSVFFNLQYNQREANQPAVISYANFGPLWNCDWIGSLTFDTANAYFNRGQGGIEYFTGFDPATQTYRPSAKLANQLVKLSTTQYEIRRPDGGKLVFALPDNSVAPSRIFMTAVVDPQGNAATLTYDANFRLLKITDAIGQQTTLTYGSGAQSLLVTKVTDPFGRFATFGYSATGHLTNITDVIGLTSRFTYSSNDTLQTLSTDYGVTSFAVGGSVTRFVEITHPNGEKERFEQDNGGASGLPPAEPTALVPTGILANNAFLNARNTRHWDRKAMTEAPGDPTRARIYHFMHQDLNTLSPILESVKMPMENRVWFNYQGQNSGGFYNYGMYGGAPSKVARVLEDGTTQLLQASFNALGLVTKTVDPIGRTVLYAYAPNNIDVLEVRRVVRPNQTARLATFTWNNAHLPLTATDAAGQTTTFTYNARGQPLTVANPRGETTTFSYNASNYLIAVDGPLAGTNDTVSFTYDAFGRTRTVTDVDGYTITYDYDALDRLTKATYPDGTFQQWTYRFLDTDSSRDRRGRVTTFAYDALRRLVSSVDPLGRTNRFDWCGCGSLHALFDPLGRMTQWEYDLAGRQTAKIYADGSRETYIYDATGRLKSRTDPKGQTKLFLYHQDDSLSSVSYPSALIATPTVRFFYDPYFPRLSERLDGAGSTRYDYYPITSALTLGAGMLASEDGPLPNDTITYSYDVLGRVVNMAINGDASTAAYDALGRVTNAMNALGSFNYAYVGATPRLASAALPNGQNTTFDYFPNIGDRQLREIWHKLPGGATLSKFDYAYDAEGQITSWQQQRSLNPPRTLIPTYDLADRLTGAMLDNPTRTYAYTYDAADNRLSETIDGVQATATHNVLNELVNLSTNTLPERAYEWDAEDRLVTIKYTGTGAQTDFTYDGMDRRVRIVEKTNGIVTADRRFVWCGYEICEERDSSAAVTKRLLPQGIRQLSGPNAGNYFCARDHLGSVTELTDASGTLRARYEFDPWGRRARVAGDLDTEFGYAGYYLHGPSSLHLAPFRAYDAALGRWVSRDPIGESGGLNQYAYVADDPLNNLDPMGLDLVPSTIQIHYQPDPAEAALAKAKAEAEALKQRKAALQKQYALQEQLRKNQQLKDEIERLQKQIKKGQKAQTMCEVK